MTVIVLKCLSSQWLFPLSLFPSDYVGFTMMPHAIIGQPFLPFTNETIVKWVFLFNIQGSGASEDTNR